MNITLCFIKINSTGICHRFPVKHGRHGRICIICPKHTLWGSCASRVIWNQSPLCVAQVDLVSTCIIAETLSLLSPPVEPDAEAHQNDPAGPSDARDEGRLLHHVRDLLRDAVVPAHDHIPEVFTYMDTHPQEKNAI